VIRLNIEAAAESSSQRIKMKRCRPFLWGPGIWNVPQWRKNHHNQLKDLPRNGG
jgi:hypothetical protein